MGTEICYHERNVGQLGPAREMGEAMTHQPHGRTFVCAVFVSVTLMALAGCSSTIVAMKPDDRPGKAQGYVPPLADLIRQTGQSADVSTIKVVFIHGVGDHCPGYALGDGTRKDNPDASAWLSAKNLSMIGLSPAKEHGDTQIQWYESPIHGVQPLGGKPENVPWFAVATRTYDFAAHDGRHLRVDATEITWSGLTQIVKSDDLGYDTTEQAAADSPCSTEKHFGAGSPPGTRETLNQMIKESLFNTALADAVLYMGPYKAPMQLAVAYGLCQAIGGGSGRCTSPAKGDRYIFVTHSLGSRILYDVLRGLHDEGDAAIILGHADIPKPSADTIVQVMNATPAIYMMANQFVLLGLANLSTNFRPGQPLGALSKRYPLNTNADLQPASNPADIDPAVSTPLRLPHETGGLQAFLSSNLLKDRSDTLNIVAFNDINDVLSWGIPKQYDTNKADTSHIQITNVYVRNERWLPWLVELPVTAHTKYFDNQDVWRVISQGICGDGRPAQTCRQTDTSP